MARLTAPSGEPLAARVGIATGLVVVGDLIGEGAAQEEAVVGETPNLAARLQALAGPGTVVVAGATRHLLGRLFDFVDLGARDLPGFADPVAAFRVTAARTAESRFEARQSGQPRSTRSRARITPCPATSARPTTPARRSGRWLSTSPSPPVSRP